MASHDSINNYHMKKAMYESGLRRSLDREQAIDVTGMKYLFLEYAAEILIHILPQTCLVSHRSIS